LRQEIYNKINKNARAHREKKRERERERERVPKCLRIKIL